jgi:proteasome lid subunit RPN8/RPN11
VQLPAALLEELLEHARREAPNECCGFVALEDGRAVEVLPAENIAASPMRFEVGPADLLRIPDIEDAGRDVAIYHSHTRSRPYPSQTDVNFAANWPGVQWLIIGLAGDEPEVRNYRIDDGVVAEVEVAVDGRDH